MSSTDATIRSVDDDKVLTFDQWCRLNAISVSTGRRLLTDGSGPQVLRLSEKRIGITVAANRAWQQSRMIGSAA